MPTHHRIESSHVVIVTHPNNLILTKTRLSALVSIIVTAVTQTLDPYSQYTIERTHERTMMMMMMRLLQELDHELSLLSAVAFLVLFMYLAVHGVRWLLRQVISVVSSSAHRQSTPPANASSGGPSITTLILLLMIALDLPSLFFHTGITNIFSDDTDGLADFIQGRDPRLDQILERAPLIRQGPSPPFLFRNRHIQFLPWLIQNEIHRQEGIPFQRIRVEVTDCLDKVVSSTSTSTGYDNSTCSSGSDHHQHQHHDHRHAMMKDIITLDVFPPFEDGEDGEAYSKFSKNFNKSSPVILFSPGLRCYSQDMPGNMIIRKAYEQGIRSIVVNRRGHTPNQPLQSPRWNLFGDVDDLEQIYWYVKDQELVASDTAMFLHGISSGTAVTVTALAKWDRRRKEEPNNRRIPVFVSSVAVTPGYDISKVMHRERFLFPYNDVLLGGVKDHFVIQNEALLRSHNNDAVDQMLAATSLQDLVDAAVPFAGYENTTLYYQDTNPINEVRDITTPKLVLNARDDPCCNIANLYEQSPYPQHDGKTFAEMISETENGMVAVARTGSHCPFLCSRDRWLPFVRDPLNGGWMLNSWADQVAIDYYLATLHVYGDERRKL